MTKKRKQYSKQFKIDAVKLIAEQGCKVLEAAGSLRIHKQSRRKYGTRRMSEQLRAEGYDVGCYKARNLMKKAGVGYLTKENSRRLPTAIAICRWPRTCWTANSMSTGQIPHGVPI